MQHGIETAQVQRWRAILPIGDAPSCGRLQIARAAAARLGQGAGFPIAFWYLTVHDVVPWLILTPSGLWLDRRLEPGPAGERAPERDDQG